jgi:peptidoglycan/LPS O-acetylase OafA/YrhL
MRTQGHGAAPEGASKLLGLEIIRFACAVAVLFWHYQHFAYAGTHPTVIRDQQPFFALFRFFYVYGYYGVQFFWAISGFIFFWKYRDAIADRGIDGRTFFVLRFSRLYPLHFLTLIAVAVLQLVYYGMQHDFFVNGHNDAWHFLLQIFFASNWGFQLGDSFNGPIWSISVEVLVYMLFFAVLRFAGKADWINVAILGVWAVLARMQVTSPILDCICYFYLGGLAAICGRHLERTRLHTPLVYTALVAAVGLPILAIGLGVHNGYYFNLLFLRVYAPILVYAAAYGIAVGPRAGRVVEALGNMTYSSYLLHFPLQLSIVIAYGLLGLPVPYRAPWFFLAFMAATLIGAFLIYRHLEMPAQAAVRRRFRARPVAAPLTMNA